MTQPTIIRRRVGSTLSGLLRDASNAAQDAAIETALRALNEVRRRANHQVAVITPTAAPSYHRLHQHTEPATSGIALAAYREGMDQAMSVVMQVFREMDAELAAPAGAANLLQGFNSRFFKALAELAVPPVEDNDGPAC
jgi:LmbE family N-acetylglucosaminyl deacetylase